MKLILSLILLSFSAWTVAGQELALQWPFFPESNLVSPISWSGGTPPYTAYVLTPDLAFSHFKYQGSDLSTSWNFNVSAGTQVRFQVVDSLNVDITSQNVTVLSTIGLLFPPSPQVGTNAPLDWRGGLPPYTVRALSPDLTTTFYTYVGNDLHHDWIVDVEPGTPIVFQVADATGFKFTSITVAVSANPLSTLTSTTTPLEIVSATSVASVSSVSTVEAAARTIVTPDVVAIATTLSVAPSPSALSASISSHTETKETSSQSFSSSATPATTAPAAGSVNHDNSDRTNAGVIAGGIVGGILALGIVLGLFVFVFRQRRSRAADGPLLEQGYVEDGRRAPDHSSSFPTNPQISSLSSLETGPNMQPYGWSTFGTMHSTAPSSSWSRERAKERSGTPPPSYHDGSRVTSQQPLPGLTDFKRSRYHIPNGS